MNLDSYFKRIEYSGEIRTDLATLRELHLHHATHIPFENLDIQLGLPISLSLDALEDKLVTRKRGGYCFEQNTFFLAVLRQIGFQVIACDARVRMGREIITPRTHMMLVVKLDGAEYIADVGFGGEGLLYPVSMSGAEEAQFLWKYRVVEQENLSVLQALHRGQWMDHYGFVAEHREPVDFEVANWYTSTHPQSRFVLTLTAQRPSPEARYILRNRIFTVQKGDAEETREISSREELMTLLRDTFHLPFPAETKFRNPSF